MEAIADLMAVQPELRREIELRDTADTTRDTARTLTDKAMSGDLVLVVTPATLGSSAVAVTAAIGGAEGKFTRNVTVTLKTAGGDTHSWFNGTFSVAGSEVTAGNGTCATSAATVTLVNGVGTCTLEYIGTWALGDTATVTVTGGTKLGYSITNKTSVDTLIA
jgi:hypothetical protein